RRDARLASTPLFHRFQAADHRLDARAYLLVLLQQRGTFGGQGILPLPERAVLVLELVAHRDQRVHALFQPAQLVLERRKGIFGHGRNIEPARRRINRRTGRCGAPPAAWPPRVRHGIIARWTPLVPPCTRTSSTKTWRPPCGAAAPTGMPRRHTACCAAGWRSPGGAQARSGWRRSPATCR